MSLHLTHLGSAELASRIALRANENVPAYKRFLSEHGATDRTPFGELPLTDKSSYLRPSPYAELLGDDFEQTFSIFSSSGSSGQAFYWPQLKSGQAKTASMLRTFLENSFAIHRRKTLAVVGLALGSWIGGDHVSWALKSVAVETPYPFSVFSPGSRHDEIIEMIRKVEPFVDQVLLFVCPSAIGHLQLRAKQHEKPLPLTKMRYVTLGEPFPETLRSSLQSQAGATGTEPAMLSVYGSADTGVLGAETRASVAVRKLLSDTPDIAQQLGIPLPAPHLFHFGAADAFVESVDGELCITRWQGVPLVRYNLHDAVTLLSWNALREAVLVTGELRDDVRTLLTQAAALPDVMAISGRADRCLILCGTNLTEAMLDEAIRTPELADRLTGVYRAGILYEEGRQYLALELEFKPQAPADLDAVYSRLINSLGRSQPEFLDDWQNVYRAWDADPPRRILRLTARQWPALSSSGSIKQRGIVS